jgi:hypothetical protein
MYECVYEACFFSFFSLAQDGIFLVYTLLQVTCSKENADILIRGIPFLSQLLEIWDEVHNLTDIISKQFSTE